MVTTGKTENGVKQSEATGKRFHRPRYSRKGCPVAFRNSLPDFFFSLRMKSSLGRGVMLWMAAATAVGAFPMSGPSLLARRVPAAPQLCRAGPLAVSADRSSLSLCPRHVKALPFSLYVFESVKVQAAKAPLNSETLSIAVGSFSLASLLINRYGEVTCASKCRALHINACLLFLLRIPPL